MEFSPRSLIAQRLSILGSPEIRPSAEAIKSCYVGEVKLVENFFDEVMTLVLKQVEDVIQREGQLKNHAVLDLSKVSIAENNDVLVNPFMAFHNLQTKIIASIDGSRGAPIDVINSENFNSINNWTVVLESPKDGRKDKFEVPNIHLNRDEYGNKYLTYSEQPYGVNFLRYYSKVPAMLRMIGPKIGEGMVQITTDNHDSILTEKVYKKPVMI